MQYMFYLWWMPCLLAWKPLQMWHYSERMKLEYIFVISMPLSVRFFCNIASSRVARRRLWWCTLCRPRNMKNKPPKWMPELNYPGVIYENFLMWLRFPWIGSSTHSQHGVFPLSKDFFWHWHFFYYLSVIALIPMSISWSCLSVLRTNQKKPLWRKKMNLLSESILHTMKPYHICTFASMRQGDDF